MQLSGAHRELGSALSEVITAADIRELRLQIIGAPIYIIYRLV